jgi:hypothetical protein
MLETAFQNAPVFSVRYPSETGWELRCQYKHTYHIGIRTANARRMFGGNAITRSGRNTTALNIVKAIARIRCRKQNSTVQDTELEVLLSGCTCDDC